MKVIKNRSIQCLTREAEPCVEGPVAAARREYTKPKLQKLDVTKGTRSGSPNQSFDGASIFDFLGPRS